MSKKIKVIPKTINISEVSYFRNDILDGIDNCNWYEDINVLLLSICRLHEIGYRKLGHRKLDNFDTAIVWQINAEKVK